MAWNELTSTLALAIDNDRAELELVTQEVRTLYRQFGAIHWITGEYLKNRYSGQFERCANPDSKTFIFQLMGMLLNEVVGQIDWDGLAQHYIEKVKEGA